MGVCLLVNYVSRFFLRGCMGVLVWVWEFKHIRAPVQGLRGRDRRSGGHRGEAIDEASKHAPSDSPQVLLSRSHYFLSDLSGSTRSPSWVLVESTCWVGKSGRVSSYFHRGELFLFVLHEILSGK